LRVAVFLREDDWCLREDDCMDPIMVRLGPLAIRWYGILIALAVVLGTLWAMRAASRRGLKLWQ